MPEKELDVLSHLRLQYTSDCMGVIVSSVGPCRRIDFGILRHSRKRRVNLLREFGGVNVPLKMESALEFVAVCPSLLKRGFCRKGHSL